ncbi:MAG: TonB-dependent receptor plug domain-containing protein [Bacteroidales bacterium]|nr:TonB-dependent receptor plug domain-containing protein [Bacteroidales bacterium]
MKRFVAIILLTFVVALSAYAQKGKITVHINDQESGAPIEGALVSIDNGSAWAESGKNGIATIYCQKGSHAVEVSMLGYVSQKSTASVPGRDTLYIKLSVNSLYLDDVVVTATRRNSSGDGTAVSHIGRQAIDHLQAVSLADVVQLLPGEVVTNNSTLTSAQRFMSRTLDSYDSNNSFGAAVIVDGIPMSSNTERANTGGTMSSSGAGIDLRNIGTDNVESIEIIRGIPSAQYGDLSSSMMKIQSRSGISDLTASVKIYPGIYQASAGKGFRINDRNSISVSFDWADGKSDPRYTTDTYNRSSFSALYDLNLSSTAKLKTKFAFMHVREWEGPDPSEIINDTWSRTRENSFSLSHGGSFSPQGKAVSAFGYDLSASIKFSDSRSRLLVHGGLPLINSGTDGSFMTEMLPQQYYAYGGSQSRPFFAYGRIYARSAVTVGRVTNDVSAGMETRYEGNYGKGFTNDNPSLPLYPSSTRPRAYDSLPFIGQASAYVEDNFKVTFTDKAWPSLGGRLGMRFTAFQPFRQERIHAADPRLTFTLEISRHLRLRAGYGHASKMPSQSMMYPDVTYIDVMNINAYKGDSYLGMYTTRTVDHQPNGLKAMTSRKKELAVEYETPFGQNLSVTAYVEKSPNGFSSDNSEWGCMTFDRWLASELEAGHDGKLTFDPSKPTMRDTLLFNITRSKNSDVHITKGIEFDFNLGKIKATGTSFFLSGAYLRTEYYSSNDIYVTPRSSSETYAKTYVVYEAKGRQNVKKRFAGTLRIVQGIPSIGFVLSASVQGVFYDYSWYKNVLGAPLGYLCPAADGKVKYVRFTTEDIAGGGSFRGYDIQDQIYSRNAYSDVPEKWPLLWSAALRVSKTVSRNMDLSFHINNLFFHQPWQKSSVSTSYSERNSSLFSYGLELSVHF